MASGDVLQRLLTDPVFRAAYLAGRGSPLEALEARESRSSLAGVVAGSAVEAVALLGLADDAQAAVAPVIENHNLVFDAAGIGDLRAGRIDPRIVSVLDQLSREHRITVSAMRSDHDRLTAGGSVSNHSFGRAVDIAAIDGRPVTPDNEVARRIAIELGTLDPAIRPTEIGSPWALPGTAYFTDAEHQNHLHIAFDDPLDPSRPLPATPDVAADPSDADGSDDTEDACDDNGGDDDEDEDDDVEDEGADDDADDEEDENGDADDEDDAAEDDADDEDEPDEDERGPDQDDREDPDRGDAPDAPDPPRAGPAPDLPVGAYPGAGASKEQLAGWMAARAQARGLPGELPVMAALVESGLSDLGYGDADSVGFFQMRTGIWNSGPYAGYPDDPELQLDWFLDQAEAAMKQRVARGLPVDDPSRFGEWIADIERPAEQYRGRYQLRLGDARDLLDRLAAGARKLRVITSEEAARARGR
jgi:hypothetical protein